MKYKYKFSEIILKSGNRKMIIIMEEKYQMVAQFLMSDIQGSDPSYVFEAIDKVLSGNSESRRIVCDYMLNVNDFISRAVFEDEIGRYCYPVDIHVMNTDKEEYERFREEYQQKLRYKRGESYGIPYRSLIPVSFRNVLVAGRCIGTDRQMQASVRVMPGCFITGQAAGAAASLACETEDVRKISVKKLQEKLLKLGAYIPHNKLNDK